MRKILLSTLFSFIVLIGGMLYRTFTFSSGQIQVERVDLPDVEDNVIERLQKSIRLKTITYEKDAPIDTAVFRNFHSLIENAFPNVAQQLDKKIIHDFSFLYTWKGKNPSLKPVLLLAHYDVVPAENIDKWEQPPFDARLVDNYVWGRGTLDDKLSVMAILESIEKLLEEGYVPERTVYLGFGHTEEVGGQGAPLTAKYLKEQGLQLAMVLDEGMVITKGIAPGLKVPLASIGIAEKGVTTLKLSVDATGGHASMPPKETAVGILSKAIVKLENNPPPQKLKGITSDMLEQIGPQAGFPLNVVFANQWLFGPVLKYQLAAKSSTNAITRTTYAPTMLKGSAKENVMADKVEGWVNVRIFPGETIESSMNYVAKTINDERVHIKDLGGQNPSPVSGQFNEAYTSIYVTIRQVFPEAVVAPALVVAATDSRFYLDLADDVYRFLPVVLTSEDIGGIHGYNERIGVEAYKKCIQFYYQLIKNLPEN